MFRNVLLIVFALISTPCRAEFVDGNKLLDLCKSTPNVASVYVAGVFDYSETVERTFGWVRAIVKDKLDGPEKSVIEDAAKVACVPEKSTDGQLRDIVCKYLVDNPVNRHSSAALQVGEALRKAYPCPR